MKSDSYKIVEINNKGEVLNILNYSYYDYKKLIDNYNQSKKHRHERFYGSLPPKSILILRGNIVESELRPLLIMTDYSKDEVKEYLKNNDFKFNM